MTRVLDSLKHKPLIIFLLAAVIFCFFPIHQGFAAEPTVRKNPYAEIDWNRIAPYKANLHCHTVYSDGRAEPKELIYAYAEAGYSILAIADHDNYYTRRQGERDPGTTHETTWPWTRWINEKPERTWEFREMETAAFYPALGEKGMLAIRANELTSDPHIVSLFNDCGFPRRRTRPNAEHDHERIGCVENKGGIAYWAHPSIYVPPHGWQNRFGGSLDAAIDYFGKFLTRYECLPGVEITQYDIEQRMPEAIIVFDRLLQNHYREHDIFLFGSDDNHQTTVADNAVMTIVLAEELTAEAVRRAFERGHTLVGQRSKDMPTIKRISVDEGEKTITLDVTGHEKVVWIKDGEEHGEGLVFDYSALTDSIVRFQIVSDDIVFYSQAFHIGVR